MHGAAVGILHGYLQRTPQPQAPVVTPRRVPATAQTLERCLLLDHLRRDRYGCGARGGRGAREAAGVAWMPSTLDKGRVACVTGLVLPLLVALALQPQVWEAREVWEHTMESVCTCAEAIGRSGPFHPPTTPTQHNTAVPGEQE